MRRATVGLFVLLLLGAGCGKKGARESFTGVLEGKSVHVPAMVGGKLERIFVEVGDEVSVGDTLALLDTTDLSLQRRSILAGMEALNAQRQMARTQIQRARFNLDYARQRYRRLKKLFYQQAAPQQRLDDAENQLRSVESAYRTAKQQLAQIEAKQKELLAQMKILEKKLHDAWILAPVGGMVTTRYFEAGEAVPPYQPVVEIIHLREMEMKIYLPEEMLSRVKVGQSVRIKVDGRKKPFTGKIIWISPKAEFTPKTILTPETRVTLVYAAKLRVANPQGVLKHGMPAEAWLE